MIQQAVILAGGLGRRLAPFTDENPKPMYPIHGIPFIEYLVRQVKGFGIGEIVFLLGYKAEKIMDYLGDGSRFGLEIKYLVTSVEYETGSRLRDADPYLRQEFLLMYCDNICPVDFQRLQQDYMGNHARIQLSVYANQDNYTKSNLRIKGNGCIELYDKKRMSSDLQGVDIGYAIVSRECLDMLPEGNCNFEAAVYPQVVAEGRLYATVTHHRYYSIGSWERIKLTKEFLRPRKVVFLDRDGTINARPPKACYVERPEEFIWLEGAIEAVKLLKEHDYEIYLVSNQPGVARGNLTMEMLDKIHEKMQDDLSKAGACIDGIYCCVHNWDDGCFCRKPKPGLFYQAQKKHSLNLHRCVMIGDDKRDMEAAQAAGIKSFLVNEEIPLLEIVKRVCGEE